MKARAYTLAEIAAQLREHKGLNLTENEVLRVITLQAEGREVTTARRADGTDIVGEIIEPDGNGPLRGRW